MRPWAGQAQRAYSTDDSQIREAVSMPNAHINSHATLASTSNPDPCEPKDQKT